MTERFVTEGGITFYAVAGDLTDNKSGSMSDTNDDNTFAYTVSRAEVVEEEEESRSSSSGGGSSSGTRVDDRVTPTPLVLGASDSPQPTAQELPALLTGISAILAGIQSGNEAGDISDEDAEKLIIQLGQIVTVLSGMFR